MKKLLDRLGKFGFVGLIGILPLFCLAQGASADIVYRYDQPDSLPSAGVRGLLVELDVKHAQGINITEIGTVVRGTGAFERSFGLYYFAGPHDADIDGTPAHQVADQWRLVGLVDSASYSQTGLLNFTLNQGDASSGSLTLAQGLYTFMFWTEANTGDGNNGIDARRSDDVPPGTVLPPDDPAASEFVDLLLLNTKQGFTSGLSGTNLSRFPTSFEMTFTAIPEPSSGIVLISLLLSGFCLRRRFNDA